LVARACLGFAAGVVAAGERVLTGGEAGVEPLAQLDVEGLIGLFQVRQPHHARAPVLVVAPFADLPQSMTFA
jgi:hypothetical protein